VVVDGVDSAGTSTEDSLLLASAWSSCPPTPSATLVEQALSGMLE
jgi:hypothetical protein